MENVTPMVPQVIGDPVTGEVVSFTSRYSRDIALTAVHQMGGAEGLVRWAKSKPAREDSFWEKIFPKTITKEVILDDRRNVVDLLAELDAEDEGRKLAGARPEVTVEASFTNFAPVRMGIDDGDDED